MPSPIAVRRDTGSSNPHSGTTQQDETSAGPAARPNQKGHPTPDKQVDGPNQKTTQNRKIPMTKLTASTDSTAKLRAARKVAKPVEAAASLTEVSDDLVDLYRPFLEPVPAPENLAAPDSDMGARSVGLGVAVGVSVAADAAIEGAGFIARGIGRLLR
jgi:hypothetical protein